MTHHIVIIGWDSFARAIVEDLIAAEQHVAVVVNDKSLVDEIYSEFTNDKVFVLFSQYDQMHHYEKVNIRQSNLVFVNTSSDTDNLICILNIKQQYPDTQFLVTLEKSRLKDTFVAAGVTYVLSKNDIAAKLVASYIFEPDVAGFNKDLISHSVADDDYDIQEYKVLPSNPFAGKLYGEMFTEIRARLHCLAVGLVKVREGKRHLLKLPPDETMIEIGDYVIFLLSGGQVSAMRNLFQTQEGVQHSDR